MPKTKKHVTKCRIPEILEEKGMSIGDLAFRAGLSYNTTFKIVKGHGVGLETALIVAHALGKKIEEIWELDVEKVRDLVNKKGFGSAFTD